MLGASDRTGEFRACTQLLHDRMLSGRLRLKPPHPKRNYSCDHAPTADLVAKSKQVSEELKMTVSKMSKLKLLLENASHSSPEVLSKLIEVIQYDIMDLNKTKLQLKANVSEAKERSTTGLQHLKHIDLIVIGLEYHLSFLVSEFRVVLEGHKTSLSTDSKKLDANIHVNTDPNPSTGYTVNSGIIESNKHSPSNHTSATSIPTIHLLKDQLLENKNQQCSSNLSNSTLSHVPPIHNSYSASSLPTIIPIAKSNGTLTVNRSEVYNSFQAETKSRTTEQLQIFASNPHVSLIDQEVRQRDAAIRRVESTIVQLGEIYQQFSTLVQEQNDLVLRIDSQTDNVEMNINEAHAQLLVFMRRISAQRGFLIKAFITIILCFVVFAWMMSACTTTLDSVDFCVEDATDENIRLPSKRHYRQRAHCNPWSDHTFDYPLKPELMDWDKLFGSDQASSLSVNNNSFDPIVRFLDVGCGYGGLLFSLSTSYPFTRSVGLEIRLKVCDFVQEKIKALRLKHSGQYNNVACIRTNAMKFLPNFFHKGQLHKIFFLYPDPHFKRVKHKWRIISPTLLDTYAYLLTPGGRIYSATDVADLGKWIVDCLYAHPLFRPVCHVHLSPAGMKAQGSDKLLKISSNRDIFDDDSYFIKDSESFQMLKEADPVLKLLEQGCTEEAHKACREGRETFLIVYERIPND